MSNNHKYTIKLPQLPKCDYNPINEDKSNQDPDYLYHKSYYDSINETIIRSSSLVEDRTFKIATGGLALSLTFFVFIADKVPLTNKMILFIIIIWLLFSSCIILHYISHFVSIRKAKILREDVAERIKESKPYDVATLTQYNTEVEKSLVKLNYTTYAILFVAIFALIAFSAFCVKNINRDNNPINIEQIMNQSEPETERRGLVVPIPPTAPPANIEPQIKR